MTFSWQAQYLVRLDNNTCSLRALEIAVSCGEEVWIMRVILREQAQYVGEVRQWHLLLLAHCEK